MRGNNWKLLLKSKLEYDKKNEVVTWQSNTENNHKQMEIQLHNSKTGIKMMKLVIVRITMTIMMKITTTAKRTWWQWCKQLCFLWITAFTMIMMIRMMVSMMMTMMMTMMLKMTIMPVSRDDLFLWQAAMLSATGAVSHVQFSPTWNHDDDDHDDDDHSDDDDDDDDE